MRALEYWACQYKRTWRGSLVSSFLNPVLFLAAMGVGLGSLVDKRGGSDLDVRYLVFLAPGLLAATAMQTAANESTFPVMAGIKWVRTYHAMVATPLRPLDVLLGHLTYIALRLLLAATVFLGVMVAFGAGRSPAVLFAVPASVLTGMAFAAPFAAFAATQDNDTSFALLMRFLVVPMFLFSGVFFPVAQLPAALRPVAYATPLWHGVALCRSLALGTGTIAGALGHVVFQLVFVVGGIAAGAATYRRRLVP